MSLPHAQLVPLPRLLQTIRFPSDHNTRWRLLNLLNNNLMIYPNTSKTLFDLGGKSVIQYHALHDILHPYELFFNFFLYEIIIYSLYSHELFLKFSMWDKSTTLHISFVITYINMNCFLTFQCGITILHFTLFL